MSLISKIDQDVKTAMVTRDEVRLSTLRFLKSALKYAAIEKKIPQLADPDIMQVIQKQIKQRRESIDQFSKGGRAELAEKETKELAILESYLPKQIADKELEGIVVAAAKEAGAVSKKDFGRVMKLLQEKLAGQAEARKISEILGRILA
jgi:uncharacterized protein YqeY